MDISGSPSQPIVTAVGQMGTADIRTLLCEISNLDYGQRDFYYWKWKFNGSDIQENSKYNMSYDVHSPNVCLQSVGLMSLTITNFSMHDFGQYKCMLTRSNTTVGEDDTNVLDAGKTYSDKYFSVPNFCGNSTLARMEDGAFCQKKKNTNGTFRETRKIKIWDLVRQIMLKADILEILGNFTSRH